MFVILYVNLLSRCEFPIESPRHIYGPVWLWPKELLWSRERNRRSERTKVRKKKKGKEEKIKKRGKEQRLKMPRYEAHCKIMLKINTITKPLLAKAASSRTNATHRFSKSCSCY